MGQGELNYKISITAETRVLRQLEVDLQRQIILAQQTGKSYADLARQLSQVQMRQDQLGMFNRLKGEALNFAQEIPGVGRVMSALNGATGAASLAFLGFSATLTAAVKSLQEFAAAQRNVAALDAVLAQNGQLTDEYRERLQELAGQLQRTTAIADDQWVAVLTKLTQFGANPGNIERYAAAVKNLAGIVGDVDTAATLVSRALQGNFEMFSRYGISVGEAGSQTEKLDNLMRQLAQRGGGVCGAMNCSTHHSCTTQAAGRRAIRPCSTPMGR